MAEGGWEGEGGWEADLGDPEEGWEELEGGRGWAEVEAARVAGPAAGKGMEGWGDPEGGWGERAALGAQEVVWGAMGVWAARAVD